MYASGDLCLDILQNRWSPTYDVAAILTRSPPFPPFRDPRDDGEDEADGSIQSLLNDPNNASPANVEAASLHRENVKEYVKRVRETVEESWECDGE